MPAPFWQQGGTGLVVVDLAFVDVVEGRVTFLEWGRGFGVRWLVALQGS
jgi:hypothetical protein